MLSVENSSVTRAVNILRAAGVEFEEFAEALYHARAVTKERWAAIRKETKKPGAVWSTKQAMPYFFAELEHVLGAAGAAGDARGACRAQTGGAGGAGA